MKKLIVGMIAVVLAIGISSSVLAGKVQMVPPLVINSAGTVVIRADDVQLSNDGDKGGYRIVEGAIIIDGNDLAIDIDSTDKRGIIDAGDGHTTFCSKRNIVQLQTQLTEDNAQVVALKNKVESMGGVFVYKKVIAR